MNTILCKGQGKEQLTLPLFPHSTYPIFPFFPLQEPMTCFVTPTPYFVEESLPYYSGAVVPLVYVPQMNNVLLGQAKTCHRRTARYGTRRNLTHRRRRRGLGERRRRGSAVGTIFVNGSGDEC